MGSVTYQGKHTAFFLYTRRSILPVLFARDLAYTHRTYILWSYHAQVRSPWLADMICRSQVLVLVGASAFVYIAPPIKGNIDARWSSCFLTYSFLRATPAFHMLYVPASSQREISARMIHTRPLKCPGRNIAMLMISLVTK